MPDPAADTPLEEAEEPAEAADPLAAKLDEARAREKELTARLHEATAHEKDLSERLESATTREKELLDRLARLQADFENFRRRARDESAQAAGKGKLEVVKTLIPVLDNLDRALAHAEDEGLKLLARQLQATLAGIGLLVLDPTGEAFDANVHEAIAQELKDGVKAGTVLATLEKGYALDGKVVRPARVVVAA